MPENTLYYGDNLEVMRKYLPDECVDLVYLDPPFNSNRDYTCCSASSQANPHRGKSKPSPTLGSGANAHMTHSARRALCPRWWSWCRVLCARWGGMT